MNLPKIPRSREPNRVFQTKKGTVSLYDVGPIVRRLEATVFSGPTQAACNLAIEQWHAEKLHQVFSLAVENQIERHVEDGLEVTVIYSLYELEAAK